MSDTQTGPCGRVSQETCRGTVPLGAFAPAAALLLAFLVACSPAGLAGAPASSAPEPLRVGLIPNQSPETVRGRFQPFADYLQQTLGRPVTLFVATDYAGVVEAMTAGKLDLAYFGGFTYVQARQRAAISPIVTDVDRETGTTRYYSAIIVPAGSPARSVADLGGKRFAFGDISSTSGSLYPRIMLERAGIADFSSARLFLYTGGHDATALAVANGSVEGGGVEKRVLQRLIDAGTVGPDQVRILEQALVPGYPWVVRDALGPTVTEQIARAFLDLRDRDLLALMSAERYERAAAGDYEEVSREALRLGLLR